MAEPRPSTQTVKLPEPEFIRLKTLSARTRRKHQDIILTALREYLDRQGA
jgi:predicted transcriptional regulator